MAIDLLAAVNRYILQYANPRMEGERVYRGYQNRTAISAANDGEDYCVYAISDTKRIGTNTTTFTPEDRIGTNSMREYVVEIDFCSTDEMVSRGRAGGIETLSGSYIGVGFFKEHGFGLLFADDIRPLPYVIGTNQYVYRYRVSLHITGWISVQAPQDYFEKAEIGPGINSVTGHKGPYFDNVDVNHPIKK